jgi:hypothetical protein
VPDETPVLRGHSDCDATQFLPGSSARRRPSDDMTDEELRAEAVQDLARGTDLVWSARLRLSTLDDRGQRVKGAYAAAVKATESCDRALAKAPRRSFGAPHQKDPVVMRGERTIIGGQNRGVSVRIVYGPAPDHAVPVAASDDGMEVWTIRVCECGCPLGATLVAIKVKKCPDCGLPTIPVEDVTRSVDVAALGDAQGDLLLTHRPEAKR